MTALPPTIAFPPKPIPPEITRVPVEVDNDALLPVMAVSPPTFKLLETVKSIKVCWDICTVPKKKILSAEELPT